MRQIIHLLRSTYSTHTSRYILYFTSTYSTIHTLLEYQQVRTLLYILIPTSVIIQTGHTDLTVWSFSQQARKQYIEDLDVKLLYIQCMLQLYVYMMYAVRSLVNIYFNMFSLPTYPTVLTDILTSSS